MNYGPVGPVDLANKQALKAATHCRGNNHLSSPCPNQMLADGQYDVDITMPHIMLFLNSCFSIYTAVQEELVVLTLHNVSLPSVTL